MNPYKIPSDGLCITIDDYIRGHHKVKNITTLKKIVRELFYRKL